MKWVELINSEFTSQLKEEKEKGYKQSTFFENLDIPLVKARGESFFISTFVMPLWQLADNILQNDLEEEIEMIRQNLIYWKNMVASETSK